MYVFVWCQKGRAMVVWVEALAASLSLSQWLAVLAWLCNCDSSPAGPCSECHSDNHLSPAESPHHGHWATHCPVPGFDSLRLLEQHCQPCPQSYNFFLPSEFSFLPTKCTFCPDPLFFAHASARTSPRISGISDWVIAAFEMEGIRTLFYNCCLSLATANATDGRQFPRQAVTYWRNVRRNVRHGLGGKSVTGSNPSQRPNSWSNWT